MGKAPRREALRQEPTDEAAKEGHVLRYRHTTVATAKMRSRRVRYGRRRWSMVDQWFGFRVRWGTDAVLPALHVPRAEVARMRLGAGIAIDVVIGDVHFRNPSCWRRDDQNAGCHLQVHR